MTFTSQTVTSQIFNGEGNWNETDEVDCDGMNVSKDDEISVAGDVHD